MTTLSNISELAFTGERLVPSLQSPQIVYEHLHRYLLARELFANMHVLDIACGEGYGSNLLAQRSASVVGVDSSSEAIIHAQKKYSASNLRFIEGDCRSIPLDDRSVDAIACFETLEHISEHGLFLSELKRVLRPGGIVIISTPDKAQYSDKTGQKNTFHARELYSSEFETLIRQNFAHFQPCAQKLVAGSFIAPSTRLPDLEIGTFWGDFQSGAFQAGVSEWVYLIAVCSDSPLPPIRAGIFENPRTTAVMWDIFEKHPGLARQLDESKREALRLNSALSDSTQGAEAARKETASLHTAMREATVRETALLKALVDSPAKTASEALRKLDELATTTQALAKDGEVLRSEIMQVAAQGAEVSKSTEDARALLQELKLQALEHTGTLQKDLSAARDTQHGLELQLANAQKLVQDLLNQTEELASTLTEKNVAHKEIARLRTEIEKLAGENSKLSDKVRRMMQSASWKVTSPLRALRRAVFD